MEQSIALLNLPTQVVEVDYFCIGHSYGMELGHKMSEAAKAAKLTQQMVGDALGVSKGAVSHWYTNKNKPSLANLADFAKLTGASLDYLTADSGLDFGDMTPGTTALQTLKTAPAIDWSHIQGVLVQLNSEVAAAGLPLAWRQVFREDAGPRAKFLQVRDDALRGRCALGSLLLIDPDAAPSAGCIVLVVDLSGRHYLRQYRELGGGKWEATATSSESFAPMPGESLVVLGRAVQLVSMEP